MIIEKCEACNTGYGIELDRCHGYNHANAAIQRVREIHTPVEYHGQVFCSVCSYDGIPESLAYPCPTIKTLDGEQ